MRYLITGGCGFIGTNLAAALLADGHHVAVVDDMSGLGAEANLAYLLRLARDNPGYDFKFLRGDAGDSSVMSSIMRDELPAVVVHAAAADALAVAQERPRSAFEANIAPVFGVCAAMKAVVPDAKLIVVSSRAVYGKPDDDAATLTEAGYVLPEDIDELYPVEPIGVSGATLAARDLCFREVAVAKSLACVILRFGDVCGPHQFGDANQNWIGYLGERAVYGGAVAVYGDGEQAHDLLSVDDAVSAIVAAVGVASSGETKTFNVGGGEANCVSVNDLISYINTRVSEAVETVAVDMQRGMTRAYVSDNTTWLSETDWTVTQTWQQAVDALLEWIDANPALFPDPK